jgi:septum formation protein
VAESRGNLACDTDQILVCDGSWFNKPVDSADAHTKLQVLRPRAHELVTADCVVFDRALIWRSVLSAMLTMRHFSEAFSDAYLDNEQAVLGSVGAYRLEGRGIQLFADIQEIILEFLGCRCWSCSAFARSRRADLVISSPGAPQ